MFSKAILLITGTLLLASCSSKNNKAQGGGPAVAGGEAVQPASPPIMLGLWRSPEPEPAGNGYYSTREYNISVGRWEMTHTLAADKEMKKIIYVYRVEGSYELTGPSTKAAGAYNVDFKISRKFLNLRTKDKAVAKEFGFNTCKLSVGKEKEISEDTCSSTKSIKECPKEYDLAKVEASGLRLGDRPTDGEMCSPEERPEMLGGALKKLN